jgi:hypothetical protein
MIGYILTPEQKEELQGVFFTPDTFFNCVQDRNEIWFLFLSSQDIISLPEEYRYILQLPKGEYVPPPTPDPFQS